MIGVLADATMKRIVNKSGQGFIDNISFDFRDENGNNQRSQGGC